MVPLWNFNKYDFICLLCQRFVEEIQCRNHRDTHSSPKLIKKLGKDHSAEVLRFEQDEYLNSFPNSLEAKNEDSDLRGIAESYWPRVMVSRTLSKAIHNIPCAFHYYFKDTGS